MAREQVPHYCTATIELTRAVLHGSYHNETRETVRYSGKDILLVAGSDGHHPLDVHIDEIKANREDYAIYHGAQTLNNC